MQFFPHFTVQPRDVLSRDRVCSSLAVSARIAVCGTPSAIYSVTPIQAVALVIAAGPIAVLEIQI